MDGPFKVRERRLAVTVDVAPHVNIYSTMFEHKHSQIIVDDGKQTMK